MQQDLSSLGKSNWLSPDRLSKEGARKLLRNNIITKEKLLRAGWKEADIPLGKHSDNQN